MLFKTLVLNIFLVIYVPSAIAADDIESFGSIWKFSSEIKTYQEHQGLAQAWGGNLASIKNDQESSFVKSKVVGISSWFGASRLIGQANSEISWKWNDGSSWVYTDWLVGQPNDSGPNDNGGNENCVRIKNKSGWSDMSCSHLAGAVYKKSSPTTSAPTTSSPTTAFQAFNNQDFSIVEPALLFFDNQGQFSVQLNYTVGLTASDLNITVMNENCSEIDDSMPDTIKIGHQFVRNHVFSKQVLIFKETFGTSPLVSEKNQATGASSGTLRFCVLVETLTEDGVPVSFRKTNVQLTYDLTSNIFEVEGNGISENAIDTSTKEVTTKYGILACRCTKESFDCDTTKPLPLLEQNGFSFICIKTDSNSSSVKISNFDMRFEQDNETKYTAVTFGNSEPTVDDLSQVQKDGDSLKIVSRLVTVLFEKTSFDVKGNAYLVFKDATRRLVTAPVQGLRSAQETTQGDSAGNVEFSMDVTLKKATGNKVTKSANYAGIAVLTVGGFAVVAILFLGIKKTNK